MADDDAPWGTAGVSIEVSHNLRFARVRAFVGGAGLLDALGDDMDSKRKQQNMKRRRRNQREDTADLRTQRTHARRSTRDSISVHHKGEIGLSDRERNQSVTRAGTGADTRARANRAKSKKRKRRLPTIRAGLLNFERPRPLLSDLSSKLVTSKRSTLIRDQNLTRIYISAVLRREATERGR